VAVGARRHAQARRAALAAEEEARLPVRRRRAPRRAPTAALCREHTEQDFQIPPSQSMWQQCKFLLRFQSVRTLGLKAARGDAVLQNNR
jgi:hypothetical protein